MLRRGMIVLAGGRSRRMGQDKATLRLGGVTLLQRAIAAGTRAAVDRIVVVASPGQSLPSLGDSAVRIDDPIDRRHEGPLSGLAVGLSALDAASIDLAAVAPCDCPWLTAAHVRWALDALATDPACDAVVPVTRADQREIMHALHGGLRVEAAARASEALLAARQRAAHRLFTQLRAKTVPVEALPEPRAVSGCNTPQQWAAAQRQFETGVES